MYTRLLDFMLLKRKKSQMNIIIIKTLQKLLKKEAVLSFAVVVPVQKLPVMAQTSDKARSPIRPQVEQAWPWSCRVFHPQFGISDLGSTRATAIFQHECAYALFS